LPSRFFIAVSPSSVPPSFPQTPKNFMHALGRHFGGRH
jgi:hypothetical protein